MSSASGAAGRRTPRACVGVVGGPHRLPLRRQLGACRAGQRGQPDVARRVGQAGRARWSLLVALGRAGHETFLPERLRMLVSGGARSAAVYAWVGTSAKRAANSIRISTWRARKARSSSRLRRSQPVTSSLHLLALQEPQAGAMLSSV